MKLKKQHMGLLAAAAIALPSSFAAAQSAPAMEKNDVLPLKNVILYSSGVGAFVHEGELDGKTKLRFSFSAEQLNDLLKSLFIASANGKGGPGDLSVESITYPSKIPLSELLKEYRINVQENMGMREILSQLQGNLFQCKLNDGSGFTGRLTGVNSSIERVVSGTDTHLVETVYANFLTDKGNLKRIKLDDLQEILPVDKNILAEINKALSILAENSDKSAKNISINLDSKGKNLARIAYVIESPVWKTSYRLAIPDDKGKGKAFLQGWAMVENPTHAEWKDVRLSLISGRPTSFIQDLYSSIFLSRPYMQRQDYTNIKLVRHEMGRKELELPQSEACDAFEMANTLSVPAAAPMGKMKTYGASMVSNAARQVTSKAIGELYRYDIAKPVTLGSRESAMLELIGEMVEMEKVSLFDFSINPDRPMSSVILKNSSALLLPQGPVTIFTGDTYGGDASLSDLPSGQDQLLSYGVDLEVIANRKNTTREPGFIHTVKLERGNLNVARKMVQSATYEFTNQSKTPKTIIVQHPILQGAQLVSKEKPVETTANFYRFRTEIPAGKTASVVVDQERDLWNHYSVMQSDLTYVSAVLKDAKLSKEAEAIFQKIFADSAKIKDLQQEINDLQATYNMTTEAHSRTRSSLNVISGGDYRNKLTQQLAELDKKLLELTQLRESKNTELRKLKKALNDFIAKSKI